MSPRPKSIPGEKFTVGDNDAGDRVCGVFMDASFHGGSNETIGSRIRLRRPEKSPVWFEVVLAAVGASNHCVWGVYGRVFSWRFE